MVHGQARRSGARVPHGAGDPAEAGGRKPRRPEFRRGLASSHIYLGNVLSDRQAGGGGGRAPQALAIVQKLADDNPAVTSFRRNLAVSRLCLGRACY